MRKTSPDLYNLVHSLSKSEKRYLRLQLEGNLGMELMDALLSQSEYNEKRLKADHADKAFLKNLAVHKSHLYELILKLLDRFKALDELESIKKGVTKARILLSRGLFSASRKQVLKYKKRAYASEFYEQVLALLKIEKQLYNIAFPNEDFHTFFEEERSCLQKINNTNDYWILVSQANYLQKKYQQLPDEQRNKQLDQLANEPKLQDLHLALTSQSKMYFFQTKATLCFTQGQPEEALRYNRLLLELFETQSSLMQRFAETYLSTFNNYLIDCLELKNYAALESGLLKLSTIPEQEAFPKIKEIEARLFRQRYLLEINWRLAIKDYKQGVLLLPELEKGLERFNTKIDKHHLVTFYYLSAVLLFGNQQDEAALHWVNKILNDTREKVVKEIYQFSRMLNLLIHDRLENMELLTALLPNTRRYLRAKRPLYETEKRLFRYFKEKINAVDKSALKTAQQSLKTDLIRLSKEKTEARVFNYIDLNNWANTIIS